MVICLHFCSFLFVLFSFKRICWWYCAFDVCVWADVWNCQLHNLMEKYGAEAGLLGVGVGCVPQPLSMVWQLMDSCAPRLKPSLLSVSALGRQALAVSDLLREAGVGLDFPSQINFSFSFCSICLQLLPLWEEGGHPTGRHWGKPSTPFSSTAPAIDFLAIRQMPAS